VFCWLLACGEQFSESLLRPCWFVLLILQAFCFVQQLQKKCDKETLQVK
jgi:hypothetical protein